MKQLLPILLFATCCALPATAQVRCHHRDIAVITTDGGRRQHLNTRTKEPLSGKYRIVYERLDEYTLAEYREGYPHGKFERFRNGRLKEEGIYDNGLKNGTWTEFQSDGVSPRRQAPMVQGKINGTVRTYYANGKKESEKSYADSREEGTERRFDPDDGSVIYEAPYRNGKLHGKVVSVDKQTENLTYTAATEYADGQKHGTHIFTVMHGNTPPPAGEQYQTVGQYTRGKKSGTWKYLDRNGAVIREWEEK